MKIIGGAKSLICETRLEVEELFSVVFSFREGLASIV